MFYTQVTGKACDSIMNRIIHVYATTNGLNSENQTYEIRALNQRVMLIFQQHLCNTPPPKQSNKKSYVTFLHVASGT